MNVVYLRTFFVSYVLFIALCVIVIASLWWQNRKRSPEITFWLINYIFQFIALLLVTLRGIIPDLISIVLANVFIIGGTIILYEGLCRYVRKKTNQLHNIIMLAVFTLVHVYLTYVYPSATWRTVNQSVALIYLCSQAAWLMLRGADVSLRSATRATGIVFVVFCITGSMQIIVNLTIHESHYIIVSGSFGIVATMVYQISFVALTFTLFLMVSRRLSMELERELIQREQEERLILLRLSLLEFATTHSLDEVLQKTLDEVGDLLESPIGFYHFVEEDQKTLSLQAWSTRTLNEFCKAEGQGRHYSIDQAGVWVDCVYQKRTVIHNDYNSLPHRKGMPEGHAPVIRELVVPIMRGGKVMAILGVGNKPSDYNEKDVEIVSYLADVAWEIIKHKKAEEAASKYSNDLNERLKEINCLYSISEIVQKKDITQEELFKACPAIISQAYQFPEITVCRILIGDHEYHTDNFRQTEWSQNRTIAVNGEPVGLVEVCYLEERPQENDGPFLAEERNLLDVVVDILERYLEGKEAQDALRRSEEKFKQLAEVFPESIFEANMKGDITYANPHGLKQFGLADEDIAKGLNLLDFVSPNDRELVIERIQSRIQGDNKGYVEYNALKKDGSAFHALALSVPIMVDGAPVGIRGFILDITERKKTEKALRESEENFRTFFETIDDMIFVGTPEGQILFTNKAVERKLGYSMEELTKMHILDVHPADKRKEAEDIFASMFRGELTYCPLPLATKKGNLVPVETRVWFGQWNGQNCIIGISKDLSVEQEAQQRFERLFRNNPALMAVTTLPERKFYDVNNAFITKLGYTRNEIIGHTSAELGLFTDQQQSEISAALSFQGRISQQELQIRCKDGSLLDGVFSGEVIISQDKMYLLTVMIDITERKKAEDALRESETRIQAITNSANDAITMMDHRGNISYWNPAAERILGYTREEAIGKNLHKLIVPERFLPAHLAAFPEFQKSGKGNAIGKTLELVARRKDGHEIDVALSLSAVRIEGVWHAVGIIQNITERKQMENYREMSNEILQILGRPDTIKDLMQNIVDVLKVRTRVDAVGIRLRDGDDYPYIAQSGFPAEFLQTENTLTQRNIDGELCKDKDGNVILECICGLVVSGKTDPANPLFTKGGSCWTNNSSSLLDLPPEQEPRINPHNRCIIDGYASLALVPIRTKERFAGLLQFNDSRKDCFSLSTIEQMESIAANIGEALMRKEAEEQIKHLATHDLLTDLPSMRLATDRLSSALNMAHRYKKVVAVMFIDLDGFKTVNDTLGHDAGDYVLKQVAQRLLACVRETDTVARVGGDEFLIIATEINSPDNVMQIAEKVIQIVSQPIIINGQQAVVSTSIGIALFPDHSEDMDQLIKLADEAMYKVKNTGKNNYRFVNT